MSPIPLDALEEVASAGLPRPGSYPSRVLAFLAEHSREAWRAHEIAAALDVEEHTLGAALRRLHSRGLIEKKGHFWHALDEKDAGKLFAAIALTRELNERLGRENRRDWARVPHK
ncbi:MAG: MarR family transcriptional regulator [Thermoplasmatota archaeon]